MPPQTRASESPSTSPARSTGRKRIRLHGPPASQTSLATATGYLIGTMGLSVFGAFLVALFAPQSLPVLLAPFDRVLGHVEKLRTTILANAHGNPPALSQFLDLFDSLVLDIVPPATESTHSDMFIPPGSSMDELMARPFHVYDSEFYAVLGTKPTLTRIAYSPVDPLYHEAVVWYPPTDEVFFAQNAGAPAAGTGAKKSSIIQKISLAQAAKAASAGIQNNTGVVKVHTVHTNPPVINPNGGTNYRGQLVFAAEGQNADKTSQLVLVNPHEPYNTTILLNNFFGRQFNSLNDVAVHPTNRDLYFTDVTYGWLQHFRPSPNLPNQVYRFNANTGLIQAVADGFAKCNGITFSPDGRYAYIADTGVGQGTRFPADPTLPATIYRFNVESDGSWSGRKLFAYVSPGAPDGIHCDTKGNLYAGCGDGVQVFNRKGTLIGKIFVGGQTANFQFAKNRMVICAETSLWYAELGVEGAPITHL